MKIEMNVDAEKYFEREMILVDKEEYYGMIHELVELRKLNSKHDIVAYPWDLPEEEGEYLVEYIYCGTGDVLRGSSMYYPTEDGNGCVGFAIDTQHGGAYKVIAWKEM